MGLDIRWPIGLMFSLIGVLLIGYGAANSAESMRVDVNINIIWGVLLLVFGVLMLVGAVRGRKTPPPS
jgi:drug/metabolite transporter (DMT)-like permease